MSLTIEQLNAATPDEFVALLDGTYEHSPWIAERAATLRPFASLAGLKHALVTVVLPPPLPSVTILNGVEKVCARSEATAPFGVAPDTAS